MCTVCENGTHKRKFKWIELVTSGFNGETSATGFCGVLACLVSMLFLIVLIIFYLFNLPEATTIMALIDKLMLLFGIGASLLGLRKVSGVFGGKGKEIVKCIEDLQEENKKPDCQNQKHC